METAGATIAAAGAIMISGGIMTGGETSEAVKAFAATIAISGVTGTSGAAQRSAAEIASAVFTVTAISMAAQNPTPTAGSTAAIMDSVAAVTHSTETPASMGTLARGEAGMPDTAGGVDAGNLGV